jgi:hypothetical protein
MVNASSDPAPSIRSKGDGVRSFRLAAHAPQRRANDDVVGSHGDISDRIRLHDRSVFRSHATDAGGSSRVFSRRAEIPGSFPYLLRRRGLDDFDLGIPMGSPLPMEPRLCRGRGSDERRNANAAARGGGCSWPHRRIRFLCRAVASRVATQRPEIPNEQPINNGNVNQGSDKWRNRANQTSSSFGETT